MNASSVLTHEMTLDYSLTGVNSTMAVEKGLAEAEWYQSPVPRETMRGLLQRRDGRQSATRFCGLLSSSAPAS